MSSELNHKALWQPAWYELDQGLILGQSQRYWFFPSVPEQVQSDHDDLDFVFFNQLNSEAASDVRFARIVRLWHPVLGELNRVDTEGLDYIFVPVEGADIVVNAEEEPGSTYENDLAIEDWSVWVTLAEVSEPVADIV